MTSFTKCYCAHKETLHILLKSGFLWRDSAYWRSELKLKYLLFQYFFEKEFKDEYFTPREQLNIFG